jgi:TRAP-type C4-dicarboxylate transport system substrate-binding protein
MNRRSLVLAAFLAAGLVLPARAADPVTLKFGNVSPSVANHIRNVMIPFMRKVEEDSGGTVKFQEFWGGALIRAQNKQFEGMINGIQDGTIVLPALTHELFPEMGLFGLPFLFEGSGARQASIVGHKLYEQGLFSGLDKVHFLAFVGLDNAGIHFNRDISSLDDLKGLKIRIAGPEEAGTIQLLGAAPVSTAITQVTDVLSRGVVQGAIAAWSATEQFRIIPVIKTHLDLPLGTRCLFVALSKSAYDKLPAPAKKAVDDNAGLKFSTAYGTFMENDALRVRGEAASDPKRKVVTPTKAEFERVRAMMKAVHDKWIADTPNGARVYEAAQEIIASMRGS